MLEDESNTEPPCEEMPEEEIDEALAETFPASDPPPWTLGIENHCKDRENESPSESRNEES